MTTGGAPLLLDLKQRLTVDPPENLEHVVARLREIVRAPFDTGRHIETPAASSAHELLRYPVGPMLDETVDRSIVREYARLIPAFEAASVIGEAARYRRSAGEPNATVVQTEYLPPPDTAQPAHYWQEAFREAMKHGPRMVAALLFVVSDEQFSPVAKHAKRRLLDRLAVGGEK